MRRKANERKDKENGPAYIPFDFISVVSYLAAGWR
jgi:hypothetical protein